MYFKLFGCFGSVLLLGFFYAVTKISVFFIAFCLLQRKIVYPVVLARILPFGVRNA